VAVKRPKEHVKETKSRKIFSNLIPDEWILRDIQHDYALDIELEIVTEENVSGKTLLIQLKSSESLTMK
jgi:hypothetical protein